MKNLISFSSMMILTGALFTGCQQDPSSLSSIMPMKTSPPPANAHPAWTYRWNSSVTSKGRTTGYATVAVSDSDETNVTNVYTCATDNNTTTIYPPSWSASGGSISFVEKPTATTFTGTNYIKSVDVSVVNGVAKGSNVQTIYSTTDHIQAQAWCQDAATGKIAFVTKNSAGAYSVSTISTSGGTATSIYSAASGDAIGQTITWSNDGTQLAFAYKTGTTLSVKVIDASNGTENANLVSTSGYTNIGQVDWSGIGENTIAFSATKTTTGNINDYNLYTIATTNGSAETFIHAGLNGSWSPDNSELVYADDSNTSSPVNRKVTVSTGVTSGGIGNTDLTNIDWKKP